MSILASTTWFAGSPLGESLTIIAAKREGQEVLQISTYKGDRGQLVTHATCAHMKEEAGYSTMTFEIFGDYSRRIISRTARCTEKTVREQHAHGVTMVGAVIEEAREYYRRKAAGHGVRECYTFGNFADYLAAYTERTGPADVLPRDCISAAHI